MRGVACCSVVRPAGLLIGDPRSSLNDLPRSDSMDAGEAVGRIRALTGVHGGPPSQEPPCMRLLRAFL